MCDEVLSKSIIEMLVRTGTIYEECVRIGGVNDLTSDLSQEVCIILLEYEPAKIIRMNKAGKLINFIRVVIKNQCKSVTSRFYKLYKEFDRIADDYDAKTYGERRNCNEGLI